MVDWELIIPGMGLTIIGMVGVGVALSGIARTLMEGMHALSMLVFTIGLVILATGLLKGDLPRSGAAKATVVIIIGFIASFGAFLMSMSAVPTLPLFAGVLILIMIPAMVIAYAAHKNSPSFKAIVILFTSASVVGAIAFTTFGFVAPKPIEAGVIERPTIEEEAGEAAEKVAVTILAGSSVEGAQAYDPPEITVEKGTVVVWTNADGAAHTVTSGIDFDEPDFGKLFDSQPVSSQKTFSLNTAKLKPGEYPYFCTFHPYMKGKLIVVAEEAGEMETPTSTVTVEIPKGAGLPDSTEVYVPAEVTVSPGTRIVWVNNDDAAHTVTSGSLGDADAGTLFDSGFPLMKPGEKFEHVFDAPGEYPYFCQVHAWMRAKVIVS